MDKEEILKIHTIEYPVEILEALKEISSDLFDALKNNPDWNYYSGYAPPMDLSNHNQILYETFGWIADTNEILINLKLIIGDLSLYDEKDSPVLILIEGNKKDRFYLLIRTFFYEFFRIKEVFNIYLSFLRKKKWLTKKHSKAISSAFYRYFEPVFKLRNQLVHQRHVWPGQKHFFYSLTTLSESMGYNLVDKESGETIYSDDIVAKLAKEKIDNLIIQTKTISQVLSDLAVLFCKIIEQNRTK